MPRLFIAVDLSDQTRQSLSAALSWMGKYENAVKIVPPQNYHVTLKFLGSTPDERIGLIRSALERATEKAKACELRLNGWGSFPETGHPKVFWVGVESAVALQEIFEQCETALEDLGTPREAREFQSHVTVGRTGRTRAPAGFLEEWRAMGSVRGQTSFRAERITLYESVTGGKASLYRTLGFFKLVI